MNKMKPAYKMKKSDIIMELKEVYGVDVSDMKLKRDLVYKLQSCRMGTCSDCNCKGDLQDINVDDMPYYKQFWNMFKFWN